MSNRLMERGGVIAVVEITLSQVNWDYIQENVLPRIMLAGPIKVVPLLPAERDPRLVTGILQLSLSEKDAEQVTEELLNLFCSQGLRPDDEPNSLGLYLEHLRDAFCDAMLDQ